MPRVCSSVHGVVGGVLLAAGPLFAALPFDPVAQPIPLLGAKEEAASGTAPSSSPLEIGHRGVGCVVAGRFPAFDARLEPVDNVAAARVYFRTGGSPHWYWVSMKRDGGAFRGILPKPNKSLKSFDYYIEATDRELATARTQEYSPTVAAGMGACRDEMGTPAVSSASVAVGGPQGAPPVPAGFGAAGVAVATSTGAATAAGGGSGVAGATAGGGISKGLIIGGAVAAAGGVTAAVVAAAGGSDQDPRAVDHDGDGFSALQGDCNDADRRVNPAGAVTASARPTTLVSACGQPSAVTTVTVSNLSCQSVTVSAIDVARSDTTSTCNFGSFRIGPSTATVAPGETRDVGAFGGGLYCAGGPLSRVFTCVDHTTVVVQSSAGSLAAGTYDVTVRLEPGCTTFCP